MLMLYHWI